MAREKVNNLIFWLLHVLYNNNYLCTIITIRSYRGKRLNYFIREGGF